MKEIYEKAKLRCYSMFLVLDNKEKERKSVAEVDANHFFVNEMLF